MPREIYDAIMAVRATGRTNYSNLTIMLDIPAVQRVAYEMELTALSAGWRTTERNTNVGTV